MQGKLRTGVEMVCMHMKFTGVHAAGDGGYDGYFFRGIAERVQ